MKKNEIFLIALLVFAAGCASNRIIDKNADNAATGEKLQSFSNAVVKVSQNEYPSFEDKDTRKSLLKALALNEKYLSCSNSATIYDFAGRKVSVAELKASNAALKKIFEKNKNGKAIEKKIKKQFDVYKMSGINGDGIVTFTSYYEPTTEASLSKDNVYKYPMYAKPDDLITFPLEPFNAKYKGESISGRSAW